MTILAITHDVLLCAGQGFIELHDVQDLLLAILVEQEPIKLAPSSSQIPALLAKTKQNIFDVRAQQQAAQRFQQRLQQRSAGPVREAGGAVAEAPGRRGSGMPWQGLVTGVSVSEETAAAATAVAAAAGQQARVRLVNALAELVNFAFRMHKLLCCVCC